MADSMLLALFGEAGIRHNRQQTEAQRQKQEADEEAGRTQKDRERIEKMEKTRKDLRAFFPDEIWAKLENAGGIFKKDSAGFTVGAEEFFVKYIDEEPAQEGGSWRKIPLLCVGLASDPENTGYQITYGKEEKKQITEGILGSAVLAMHAENKRLKRGKNKS